MEKNEEWFFCVFIKIRRSNNSIQASEDTVPISTLKARSILVDMEESVVNTVL